MALVNDAKREINAKIVYFGPAGSGKTTNLDYVYKKLKQELRGTMKTVGTQADKMLFFDFSPAEVGVIGGYTVRFHVYTVPGAVQHAASWKMVLKGVDGIVFVADSQPESLPDNLDSMARLDEYLAGFNQTVAALPCVMQYNKRDLADAATVDELNLMLNPSQHPFVAASAQRGEGVLQTLSLLLKKVVQRIKETDGAHLDSSESIATGFQVENVPSPPSFPENQVFTAEPEEFAPPVAEGVPDAAGYAEPTVSSERMVPELEILDGAEVIGAGLLRLPLLVRQGGREKQFVITLMVSIEDPEL